MNGADVAVSTHQGRRIEIDGAVQGVRSRPWVDRLAGQCGIAASRRVRPDAPLPADPVRARARLRDRRERRGRRSPRLHPVRPGHLRRLRRQKDEFRRLDAAADAALQATVRSEGACRIRHQYGGAR